jgi:hypothetical protein
VCYFQRDKRATFLFQQLSIIVLGVVVAMPRNAPYCFITVKGAGDDAAVTITYKTISS